MLAIGNGQGGIIIIVLAPEQIVAIESVLLNSKRCKLVRIVTEPLCVQQKLVEVFAVTFLRVDRQVATQETDPITEIDITAILSEIAIDIRQRYPTSNEFDDIVAVHILTST